MQVVRIPGRLVFTHLSKQSHVISFEACDCWIPCYLGSTLSSIQTFLSSNADPILELQTSDMLKLYEFYSFCTENVCMGDKNTICVQHPLLISCIYANLGCKWMSSDVSHHGWLGLSGALPPTPSLFLSQWKKTDGGGGSQCSGPFRGAQALSSVNSDIYWKHLTSATAEMHTFHLSSSNI